MYERKIPVEAIKQIKTRLQLMGIDPNSTGTVLFILLALDSGDIDALDAFDENNRDKKVLLLYKYLQFRGIIAPSEDSTLSHFKLTAIGESLVSGIKEICSLYPEVSVPVVERKETPMRTTKRLLPVTEVEKGMDLDWIDEYIAMWPARAPQGYYLRQNKQYIGEKMELFIKQYGYDKETIIEATRRYIEDRRAHDFQYIKKISNFILYTEKAEGRLVYSDLATWCELVLSGEPEPKPEDGTSSFFKMI